MTRTALYARVSTDLQEKEATIDSQVEDLRRGARDRGHDVVVEYLDDGYSGATLDRPGLDRLRDDLGYGKFDLVLFHSPDRLARKVVYQHLILEEMEKAGIKIEFLNFSMDDSPESRMLLGMQGLFAEYEGPKSWSGPAGASCTGRGKAVWWVAPFPMATAGSEKANRGGPVWK